jgi:3-methyl-2-oxobutanoate hydroxymethyltransferase
MTVKDKRTTAADLRRMKAKGEPITMVTGYDATFARLLDEAGVDAILVGDSLGMVIQGASDTLAVTLDEMIYHTRAVVRGSQKAHVIADMPFMSYQADLAEGVRNAGRLVKESGAQAVKVEGGREIAPLVRRVVTAGIPVMGHVGLTPQSVHAMGGFKVQGRTTEAAARILEDACALEEAGAYAVVLEGVPVELSRMITDAVSIPTIGIGAGNACDGQVLVIYDLLGMVQGFRPKFVKTYANLAGVIKDAVATYRSEVREGDFPTEAHTFHAAEKLLGEAQAEAREAAEPEAEPIDGLYGAER